MRTGNRPAHHQGLVFEPSSMFTPTLSTFASSGRFADHHPWGMIGQATPWVQSIPEGRDAINEGRDAGGSMIAPPGLSAIGPGQ